MWKFDASIETSPYTEEQIESRNKNIPSRPDYKPGIPIIVEFVEESYIFNISKLRKKSMPPSIEYVVGMQNSFMNSGNKIVRLLKQNFFEELQDNRNKEFVFDVETKGHELNSLSFGPEQDYDTNLVLASDEKVRKLSKLHIDFYSLLVQIQEANIASDFRVAYGIQDKISNILDNRVLQCESLIDDLISYLSNILEKMQIYKSEIYQKQKKFSEMNFRISRLKEYRYKTDQSFKFLNENNDIAEYEIDKNLRALEKNSE